MAKVRYHEKLDRYFIDYYVGGKRHQEFPVQRTKKAAELALAARLKEIDAGTFGLAGPKVACPLFEDWAETYLREHVFGDERATWRNREWLKQWKAENRRPLKKAWDRELTNLAALLPFFKGSRLTQITDTHVERYKNKRLGALTKHGTPVAEASVRLELACLSGMLGLAVKAKLIPNNPVRDVKKPVPNNGRNRVLTLAEWTRIKAELSPVLLKPCMLSLYCGSRIGAVLALRREDIRFVGDEEAQVRLVKTKRGKLLVVRVYGEAKAMLAEVCAGLGPKDLIFHRKNGKPIKDYRTGWKNACRRAGIPEDDRVWVHDLRRTFATTLLEQGADMVAIRDALGHSNAAVTERYLAASVSRLQDGAKAVAGVFDAPAPPQSAPVALQIGAGDAVAAPTVRDLPQPPTALGAQVETALGEIFGEQQGPKHVDSRPVAVIK